MKLNRYNQSGFSLVLLIVILLILFGLLGWFVYTRVHDSSSPSSSAEKTTATEETTPALETISSASESYHVSLPSGWYYSTCEDSDILFLAPTEDLLGKCNTEYFGPISISRSAGDLIASSDPSTDPGATDVVIADVIIDGQAGKKVSYTYSGEETITASGTKFVSYKVYYGGNTYTISTSTAPSGTSYEADLDAIVSSFMFM